MWIDSHCHLDAAEFDADRDAVVARARAAGVAQLVLPAIEPGNFDAVRALAARHGAAFALGVHPLCADSTPEEALEGVAESLRDAAQDPRLVAVGEIGLDHFMPGLDRARQERFYRAQLKMARALGLPVILHVRRSADELLAGLNRIEVPGGIAHAFNGSDEQARRFVERGFVLGFGGAMTFDRALQIRRLAGTLPDDAIVLETDSPDIPPHWLYRRMDERRAGAPQGRNEPAELPRIAATMATLRGIALPDLAALTSANVRRVLPRLGAPSAMPAAMPAATPAAAPVATPPTPAA